MVDFLGSITVAHGPKLSRVFFQDLLTTDECFVIYQFSRNGFEEGLLVFESEVVGEP